MKKFVSVIAAAVLLAFAAPVFAATNPFMDVPMNHWAYDAIGQLAAHGILSGYPDGTYKGKQPTTRYEMASALARALAVVDMTKASKQDVEMLKKLVVEFKDELEALGVKVADLDRRVSVLEDRLGGWHIHAQLRQDILGHDYPDTHVGPEWSSNLTRGRLWFERWFGDEENPMHAMIRMDNNVTYSRFYVEVPFFADTVLTAGRFAWEEQVPYYMDAAADVRYTGGFLIADDYLLDVAVDGIGLSKNFAMGRVRGFVTHVDRHQNFKPDAHLRDLAQDQGISIPESLAVDGGAWEVYADGNFQFNEQFGFDLGLQALLDDNTVWVDDRTNPHLGVELKNIWTLFAGLRFNFNDAIALKAIYFNQSQKFDVLLPALGLNWDEPDLDNPNAFKVILDVKQDMLKFTSLWAEYGQMDRGFFSPTGAMAGPSGSVFGAAEAVNGVTPFNKHMMLDDLKYWRVVLGQKWNNKWATHLFYFNYDFDMTDIGMKEYGLGVRYDYNPSVNFGLNFAKVDWDDKLDDYDDTLIRFRTQITF